MSNPRTLSTRDNSTTAIAGYIPYYMLIVAVIAVYANTLDNQFLFDDDYYIVTNRFLRSWSALGDIFLTPLGNGIWKVGAFYRPIQIAIYIVIYQLFGLETTAFHILNIALHAANACLIYALGRRLNFRPVGVWLAALVWAMHPLHTEAVTYMSGTADPLFCFFCLIGLIVLLPAFTPGRMVIAAIFFVLALLSKETAIVFPGVAAICLYLMSPERFRLTTYRKLWPLFAVAVTYIGLHEYFMPFDNAAFAPPTHAMQEHAAHFSYRLYTALATQPRYFELLIWPHDLHMERNFPVYAAPWYPDVILGAMMLLAAAAQIIFGCGQRGLALSWGLLWFFGAQVPQTGILVPANAIFLEHWMYFPSIGLFLSIAETLSRSLIIPYFVEFQRPAFAITVIFAACLGWAAHSQNEIWNNPVRFYGNIISHDNNSSRAHNNLGIYYTDKGDYAAAISQFHKALDISQNDTEAHYNLALALLKQRSGNYMAEAIAELEKALAANPAFFQADDQLAEIYATLGDKNKEMHYRDLSRAARQP